eukprot:TRINITY_DN1199_c2_g1_i2.p1 TRINITY_DN1199_c2_g1~~TRINITY_DN1199_c2_g1_i2.p1  ORF type:complete len:460 (-),score=80.07 TRINITY_DN1199_c2_g1_i2:385-1728(-)
MYCSVRNSRNGVSRSGKRGGVVHSGVEVGTQVRMLPKAPIPEYIIPNKPGTWAYDTMARRVRDTIVKKIFDENDLTSDKLQYAQFPMQQLLTELETPETSQLRLIAEDGGGDLQVWNGILKDLGPRTWLTAPWCVGEFYLYRRVAEAFQFFKTAYDPFEYQKQLGVTTSLESAEALIQRLNHSQGLEVEEGWNIFVETCLWGNRMDLSLWPVDPNENNAGDKFAEVIELYAQNLMADDRQALVHKLMQLKTQGGKRIDFVTDNAGFELISDICLADYLIQSGAASQVVFQMKAHPTFVSDALPKDLLFTLNTLKHPSQKQQECSVAAKRWEQYIQDGKFILKSNLFWCQSLAFWEMHEDVRQDLAQSSLTFVKGDANYRRLLGDREWDLSTPFWDIVNYFPSPICALRTLKAELGCGMPKKKLQHAKSIDDNYLISGKWGVIQFMDK